MPPPNGVYPRVPRSREITSSDLLGTGVWTAKSGNRSGCVNISMVADSMRRTRRRSRINVNMRINVPVPRWRIIQVSQLGGETFRSSSTQVENGAMRGGPSPIRTGTLTAHKQNLDLHCLRSIACMPPTARVDLCSLLNRLNKHLEDSTALRM